MFLSDPSSGILPRMANEPQSIEVLGPRDQSGREEARRIRLRRIETAVNLLDDVFVVPGTQIRFGLDPIIGLFPGIGDGLSAACSWLMVLEAGMLGAPKLVLLRMGANLLIDTVIGIVPFVGDLADFAIKSNRKNLQLLQSIPEHEWRPERSPRALFWLIAGLLAGVFAAVTAMGLLLLRAMYQFVTG